MQKLLSRRSLLLLAFVIFINSACKTPSLSSLTTPTNLLGMLGKSPNLSQFAGLLNQVPSVGKLLGGKNPMTVLAPTNDALSAMGTDALSKLTGSKEGLSQLGDMLKKYVIPGKVSATDLAAGTAKNLAGSPVSLGDAKLVGDAISADNGSILALDKLLK